MRWGVLLIGLGWAAQAQTPDPLARYLDRMTAAAQAFRQQAPRVVGTETLHQRALVAGKGPRLRFGSAALQQREPVMQTREVVSAYGYAATQNQPANLHEVRQVITVDGKPLASPAQALQNLTQRLLSPQGQPQRMLRELAQYGLEEAAVDLGQVLLLFRHPQVNQYTWQIAGTQQIGADTTVALRFAQHTGTGGLTVFEDRKRARQPLQGTVWVRAQDGLPVRVQLTTERSTNSLSLQDEAVVEYAFSPFGCVLPQAVTYRQFAGSHLITETVCRYEAYQQLTADPARPQP